MALRKRIHSAIATRPLSGDQRERPRSTIAPSRHGDHDRDSLTHSSRYPVEMPVQGIVNPSSEPATQEDREENRYDAWIRRCLPTPRDPTIETRYSLGTPRYHVTMQHTATRGATSAMIPPRWGLRKRATRDPDRACQRDMAVRNAKIAPVAVPSGAAAGGSFASLIGPASALPGNGRTREASMTPRPHPVGRAGEDSRIETGVAIVPTRRPVATLPPILRRTVDSFVVGAVSRRPIDCARSGPTKVADYAPVIARTSASIAPVSSNMRHPPEPSHRSSTPPGRTAMVCRNRDDFSSVVFSCGVESRLALRSARRSPLA